MRQLLLAESSNCRKFRVWMVSGSVSGVLSATEAAG